MPKTVRPIDELFQQQLQQYEPVPECVCEEAAFEDCQSDRRRLQSPSPGQAA